jgi:IS5 family transposase
MKASRYAHARQMKRAKACTRKLKTNLGRVIREIERQSPGPAMSRILEVCKRIHAQGRGDQQKVYSVHEPQTMCIAKGKAGKKYEFGQKVSVAVTSKGGWLLGAMCIAGNPYDGHTLQRQLAQVDRLCIEKQGTQTVHVDMGYRGHDYQGNRTVIVDKRRRGETVKRVWRWMKRRAAIEPTIGHLKSEHRLERNQLRGLIGDSINALLSAAAMNFGKLLSFLLAVLLELLASLNPPDRQPCLA